MIARSAVAVFAAAGLATGSGAYPGGTPDYQTDVAPFCAGCHSSLDAEALAGAPEARVQKELAENKHLAQIREPGERSGYAKLSESDRSELIKHIQAVDANAEVSLAAPDKVAPGAAFTVTVEVKGGSGPVVGVGLVDRAHRWWARPAASAGWQVVAAPEIVGPDGNPQDTWLGKRAKDAGRSLSFVNVMGVKSDAVAGTWSTAKVRFKLRAPLEPGSVPLAAVFLYGTEKASPLGTVTNAVGRKSPVGGFTGASGRVRFSALKQIAVGP